MRLLNLEFLQRAGADLPTEVVEHFEKSSPTPAPPAHLRILKGRRDNIRDVIDFGTAGTIFPEMMCRELIRYSRLSLPSDHQLLDHPVILRALPGVLTQLEISVVSFQESNIYDIHWARCTGSRLCRN